MTLYPSPEHYLQNLIVDLLAVCAARTDNKVDDQAVKLIKEKLLNEKGE